MEPSQRIRYGKTKKEGVFRSVRTFTSLVTGAIYQVELDYNSLTYRILNLKQQECVKSSEKDSVEKITHPHVLKRQAKRALKSLGVDFDMEIRPLRPDKKSKNVEQAVVMEAL